MERGQPSPPNLAGLDAVRLAQVIAAHAYGVSVEGLSAPTRGDDRIAMARKVAMYLAHAGLKQTLRSVGHAFSRNHRAVFNACKHVEAAREDPKFDRTMEWLEGLLRRACEVPS